MNDTTTHTTTIFGNANGNHIAITVNDDSIHYKRVRVTPERMQNDILYVKQQDGVYFAVDINWESRKLTNCWIEEDDAIMDTLETLASDWVENNA